MGIYSLYSIPDEKIYVFDADLQNPKDSPLVKLFGDPLSLRDIIKIMLNYVKRKGTYDADFRTQIKGISDINEEESSTFDVDLGVHEMQRIGLKRKKITSLKSKQKLAFATGPIISWTNYNYNQELPNIYQSVKAAIIGGAFSRSPLKISVKQRHFRYPVYQMQQSFNIMLVLDVSNSIKWIVKFMEKIISMLTAQASAAKDKLGLIVFQDDRAQILHYPTINVRHVIG